MTSRIKHVSELHEWFHLDKYKKATKLHEILTLISDSLGGTEKYPEFSLCNEILLLDKMR